VNRDAWSGDGVHLPRWAVWSGLGLGVLSVSFAAIIIRWADAPALSVSFWRCLGAAAALAPFAAAQRRRLLAWLLLDELPAPFFWLAAPLILVGVYVAATGEAAAVARRSSSLSSRSCTSQRPSSPGPR